MNELTLRHMGLNLLGFEDLFHNMAQATTSGYPPVNVIRKSEDSYTIEVACAGFALEDLEITVSNGLLTIKGYQKDETEHVGWEYIVKGLASRSFKRQWTLAEHVKVTGAELNLGILQVDLIREIPEEKLPKTILITSK
jgi:molecular chaperone IbpA